MDKQFPRFTVDRISDADCLGTFEPSRWVGLRWRVALRVGDRFVWGRFIEVDKTSGNARIQLQVPAEVAAFTPGESYEFIDGYWGNQAELVLDQQRIWRREEFTSVDAVEYSGDGQRIVTKATGELAGGTTIPGGWDHEHCELCNATLSEHDQPVGWTSDKGEWLCEACYVAYVVPRSIDFVPEE